MFDNNFNKEVEMMSIGENIKIFRERNGLTQEQFAYRLHVSRPLISQIERGTKTPSLPLSKAMADILNCSIEDLLKD